MVHVLPALKPQENPSHVGNLLLPQLTDVPSGLGLLSAGEEAPLCFDTATLLIPGTNQIPIVGVQSCFSFNQIHFQLHSVLTV